MAEANFPSQVPVFVVWAFMPEVFSPVRRCPVRTGEEFWGAFVGKPILPSCHRRLNSILM